MGLDFEWDGPKSRRNIMAYHSRKPVPYLATLNITIPDPQHSIAEDRWITVGESAQGRLLVVAFTERQDRIRIISARVATRRERKAYEEEGL